MDPQNEAFRMLADSVRDEDAGGQWVCANPEGIIHFRRWYVKVVGSLAYEIDKRPNEEPHQYWLRKDGLDERWKVLHSPQTEHELDPDYKIYQDFRGSHTLGTFTRGLGKGGSQAMTDEQLAWFEGEFLRELENFPNTYPATGETRDEMVAGLHKLCDGIRAIPFEKRNRY